MLQKFKKIRCFVFDIDGVMTNGKLHLSTDGQFVRETDIKDGYALQLAAKSGYTVMIVSGAHNDAVVNRLNYLGITEVHTGIKDKLNFVKAFITAKNIHPEEMLYMGDDVPDLDLFHFAGISACPKDAVADLKAQAMYISRFPGGAGCVRDVIEKVLKLHNKWPLTTEIPSA